MSIIVQAILFAIFLRNEIYSLLFSMHLCNSRQQQKCGTGKGDEYKKYRSQWITTIRFVCAWNWKRKKNLNHIENDSSKAYCFIKLMKFFCLALFFSVDSNCLDTIKIIETMAKFSSWEDVSCAAALVNEDIWILLIGLPI